MQFFFSNAVLNIIESSVIAVGEEIIFRCSVEGFPNPQLLSWQEMITDNSVMGNLSSTVTQRNDSEITVVDTLTVMNRRVCAQAGGYLCIYSSGSSLVSRALIECPPGKELTSYSYIASC